MAFTFPLVFLLLNSGAFGQNWSVIYETKSICALEGSTVYMSCMYTYPQQLKINNTFWILCEKQNTEIRSLKEYPEYKDRVEYSDKENKTGILILNNITENDERAYCFRLTTETATEWIGQPGIQLNISALQVKAPHLVLEKETVNLTCETTCNLTNSFIWYKNGQVLDVQSEVLRLQSVRSDSGSYSCAVRGHEDLRSPAVNISVMYPPQNTSVSISGSSAVAEGDSVSLICSSDSNPPALNFSWFQENRSSAVGSGQSFSISSFSSSHSGRFYCEAHNKYGSQRSAAVSLSVNDLQREETRLCSTCVWDIMIVIGVCVTVAIVTGFGIMFIIFFVMHKRQDRRNSDSQETEPEKTSTETISESVDNAEDVPVQEKKVTEAKKPEEEIEYVSIAFQRPTSAARSVAGGDNDCSVIYSTVK